MFEGWVKRKNIWKGAKLPFQEPVPVNSPHGTHQRLTVSIQSFNRLPKALSVWGVRGEGVSLQGPHNVLQQRLCIHKQLGQAEGCKTASEESFPSKAVKEAK